MPQKEQHLLTVLLRSGSIATSPDLLLPVHVARGYGLLRLGCFLVGGAGGRVLVRRNKTEAACQRKTEEALPPIAIILPTAAAVAIKTFAFAICHDADRREASISRVLSKGCPFYEL
jgi:hypothetical protein